MSWIAPRDFDLVFLVSSGLVGLEARVCRFLNQNVLIASPL